MADLTDYRLTNCRLGTLVTVKNSLSDSCKWS